jgi:hypothetical protein
LSEVHRLFGNGRLGLGCTGVVNLGWTGVVNLAWSAVVNLASRGVDGVWTGRSSAASDTAWSARGHSAASRYGNRASKSRSMRVTSTGSH